MFKKIGPCVVENDEGVSIRIVHPEIIEYREKDKIYEVGLGYNSIKDRAYIYLSIAMSSSVSKLSKLTELEKGKIIKNIKEAAKFLEGNFEVV